MTEKALTDEQVANKINELLKKDTTMDKKDTGPGKTEDAFINESLEKTKVQVYAPGVADLSLEDQVKDLLVRIATAIYSVKEYPTELEEILEAVDEQAERIQDAADILSDEALEEIDKQEKKAESGLNPPPEPEEEPAHIHSQTQPRTVSCTECFGTGKIYRYRDDVGTLHESPTEPNWIEVVLDCPHCIEGLKEVGGADKDAPNLVECPRCKGLGQVYNIDTQKYNMCPTCEGDKQINFDELYCHACAGKGTYFERGQEVACSSCKGTGLISTSDNNLVALAIQPAGVSENPDPEPESVCKPSEDTKQ
jgi:Zn finger protein HypA/HybF involved in hydrogenase expression